MRDRCLAEVWSAGRKLGVLGAILFAALSLSAQSVVVVATYPRDTNGTPARILIGAEQFASNTCYIQQATDMTHLNWFTGAIYGCYPQYQWVLGTFNIEFYSEQFFRSENVPCDPMPFLAEATYPLDAEESRLRWTFGGKTWMLNNRLESTYSPTFPFEEQKRYTGIEANP